MPMFSVIMPAYNSEKTIEAAIYSIIKQDYDDWELIVINDGSNDNTLSIVNKYQVIDNRIKVFSKENEGYVAAVNDGLKLVSGLYFLLMGSDDRLGTGLFSSVDSYLKQYDYPDMIGFRTVINKNLKEHEEKNTVFTTLAYEQDITIGNFAKKYPMHARIFSTRDTSKMYKTGKLQGLCYHGKFGMDADGIFSMMFAHNSSSFLSIPIVGYIWYLHEDSLSGRKKSFDVQKDRIENWIYFFKELQRRDIEDITETEKYYLSYFYSVVRTSYIYYPQRFLHDSLMPKIKNAFLSFLAFSSCSERIVSFEIYCFLYLTPIWYLLVPVFFLKQKLYQKGKKYLRKRISKF